MRMKRLAILGFAALMGGFAGARELPAQGLPAQDRPLAREIFKQLIETNSTDSVGSVTAAATEVRDRLLAAGFSPADVVLLGPNERKMNVVITYRGKAGSTLKPILAICHLDVVEANKSDWSPDTPPFTFTEKDGFFYGRGTQDIKEGDAALVYTLIRMKREGYVPDREIRVVLTADEEGGKSNGVDWLIKNHPELMQAEFVINPDAGGVYSEHGKPTVLDVEATEKTYADFHIVATNKGGHSSLPTPDNAIYEVADALVKLQNAPFPVELNNVTRAEFAAIAKTQTGQLAEDMKAVASGSGDSQGIARLSAIPEWNSTLRTTCVATMMTAGHAPNALPQRAQANVNCRILPGHSGEETRQTLIKLFDDPALKVEFVTDAGMVMGKGDERMSAPPPPVNKTVSGALTKVVGELWPGLAIVPTMEPGASDSIYTVAAGIPSYGLNGFAIDADDVRAHGMNERLGVESYYKGVEFTYLFMKALTE
jgi:acetylornithine deacetylase/succinyl-diaminopimelate desuccinylase-like protein